MSQPTPTPSPADDAPEPISKRQRFRESWNRLGNALEKEPDGKSAWPKYAAHEDTTDVQKWKPGQFTTLGELASRVRYLADEFPEAGHTLGELDASFKKMADVLRRASKEHERPIEFPLDAYKGILERHGEEKAKLWQDATKTIASHFMDMAIVMAEARTTANVALEKRAREEEVAALAEEQKEGPMAEEKDIPDCEMSDSGAEDEEKEREGNAAVEAALEKECDWAAPPEGAAAPA